MCSSSIIKLESWWSWVGVLIHLKRRVKDRVIVLHLAAIHRHAVAANYIFDSISACRHPNFQKISYLSYRQWLPLTNVCQIYSTLSWGFLLGWSIKLHLPGTPFEKEIDPWMPLHVLLSWCSSSETTPAVNSSPPPKNKEVFYREPWVLNNSGTHCLLNTKRNDERKQCWFHVIIFPRRRKCPALWW